MRRRVTVTAGHRLSCMTVLIPRQPVVCFIISKIVLYPVAGVAGASGLAPSMGPPLGRREGGLQAIVS